MKTYIYGKHPINEALTHMPRVIEKVFLNQEQYPEIDKLAKKRNVFRMPFDEKKLERKLGAHAVHQNIAALINAEALTIDSHMFFDSLEEDKKHSVVILGEIQDPQNVGSIIRSAAAFGVSGVLIPKDRQAQITGAVIKASAGSAFRVPLVAIGNVNQAIRELKERHFWIYGLAGDGEKSVREEDFSENSVFIIGNEAKGLREKTSEHCDTILHIPIGENAESLNAGISAAVVFYEWNSKQK